MEPVIGGERALAHEGRVDGNVELLGERFEFVVRPADAHATAGEDQRPLRARQKGQCFLYRLARATVVRQLSGEPCTLGSGVETAAVLI